jgi:NADH-quinone oxidoreductase subunit A
MTQYFSELQKIFFFISFSGALAAVLLFVVFLLAFNTKIDFETSSAYECGFQPFGETNYPFEVQFALIGVLFLLFDIEILYLFPILNSFIYFDSMEIMYFVIFFGIVILGLLYEISRKIVQFFVYDEI